MGAPKGKGGAGGEFDEVLWAAAVHAYNTESKHGASKVRHAYFYVEGKDKGGWVCGGEGGGGATSATEIGV